MGASFEERIPSMSEGELRGVVGDPLGYRREIVEAAVLELQKRGLAIDEVTRARVRALLEGRARDEADTLARRAVRALGATPAQRMIRIHELALGLLLLTACAAALIWTTAPEDAPNPFGIDAQDTKKYLREVELFGGKATLLATQLSRWWQGLWHGRGLAVTVAALGSAVAVACWLILRAEARTLDTEDRAP
jgi:hypothetical protein